MLTFHTAVSSVMTQLHGIQILIYYRRVLLGEESQLFMVTETALLKIKSKWLYNASQSEK